MYINEIRVRLAGRKSATKAGTGKTPKEHFKDIYEIDAITAGKLFQLATVVARALKEVLHCDGLNVLQNNGLIAGQTVYHFHMHLIPRYEGDDVTIGWKEHSTEDIDMEQLRQDIKKAL